MRPGTIRHKCFRVARDSSNDTVSTHEVQTEFAPELAPGQVNEGLRGLARTGYVRRVKRGEYKVTGGRQMSLPLE